MGFDAKKLRNFDTWWFNDEYMAVDWRILRKTGISREEKELSVANVSRRLSAASFSLTRTLQTLWLDGHSNKRYVKIDDDFVNTLPMTMSTFTEYIERFAAQSGNALRDDWIEAATEKILEHLELISQTKEPMVVRALRASSRKEHTNYFTEYLHSSAYICLKKVCYWTRNVCAGALAHWSCAHTQKASSYYGTALVGGIR